MERLTITKPDDGYEIREPRRSKPASPSLSDSYSLFKYDKVYNNTDKLYLDFF